MKIETHYLDDHQAQLTVEFETASFDQAKRQAARNISKRIKIPGFRPGKAPYHIVQKYMGDESIIEEGIKVLVHEKYPIIIEEAGIEPYGPGRLDEIVSISPLVLKFTIPLKAEVHLGDYCSIRVPYEPPKVSEEEVTRVIETIRQATAIEEPASRPIQKGDRVYLRIQAKRLKFDDRPEAIIIRERNYTLIIGLDDDNNNEWPFPGFSQELIGLSAGEEKTLVYTYPSDSEYTTLRNQTVEFHIQIDEVKVPILPELNDEFAQTIEEGKYTTLDELRKAIHERAEVEHLKEYHDEYDDKILEELVAISTIKYPPQMLEEEIEDALESIESRLQSQGLNLESYLKSQKISLDEFRERIKPNVEKRLKKSLVLYEFSKVEGIKVTEEEINRESNKVIEQMMGSLAAQELEKLSKEDLGRMITMQTGISLYTNRALERLRVIAMGQSQENAQVVDSTDKDSLNREVITHSSNKEDIKE